MRRFALSLLIVMVLLFSLAATQMDAVRAGVDPTPTLDPRANPLPTLLSPAALGAGVNRFTLKDLSQADFQSLLSAVETKMVNSIAAPTDPARYYDTGDYHQVRNTLIQEGLARYDDPAAQDAFQRQYALAQSEGIGYNGFGLPEDLVEPTRALLEELLNAGKATPETLQTALSTLDFEPGQSLHHRRASPSPQYVFEGARWRHPHRPFARGCRSAGAQADQRHQLPPVFPLPAVELDG